MRSGICAAATMHAAAARTEQEIGQGMAVRAFLLEQRVVAAASERTAKRVCDIARVGDPVEFLAEQIGDGRVAHRCRL